MIDAAADAPDQLAIVRGDDDRRAARVDLAEQIHDFERQIGIEVAGRLVGEHELRVVDERARDGDALLLAARQLFGKRVHAVLQADPLQHLKGLALLRRQRHAEHAHHERDVLKHRQARDEPEVLKDEADACGGSLHLRPAQRRADRGRATFSSPSLGSSSRSSSRSNVDLPAPLGPVRKRNSPLSMVSDRSRSA